MVTVLVIKEMKIKTILRFHLTPVRTQMATSVTKVAGKRELQILLVGM
jgi:hypothetical protein